MSRQARLMLRIAMVLTLLAGTVWVATQFFYRPWKVVGHSMSPLLEPGDIVWIELEAARRRPIEAGDLIVIRGPNLDRRTLVKRVVRLAVRHEHRPELWDDLGGGSPVWFWVEGAENAASVDSRSFGPVPDSRIVGRVVFRSAPLRRAGSIPSAG